MIGFFSFLRCGRYAGNFEEKVYKASNYNRRSSKLHKPFGGGHKIPCDPSRLSLEQNMEIEEFDKVKSQVSEVRRVKEEMLVDSTPSSSGPSNINTSGDIGRTWLDLIFPASFRRPFGS
jgi:hypothetical protein